MESLVHTHHPAEPVAVFFMEDGMDRIRKVSKLTEEERLAGGYLLIEPGVGTQWIPLHSDVRKEIYELVSVGNHLVYEHPISAT